MVGLVARGHTLPDGLLDSLREAFAGEVADRLPRLLAAVDDPRAEPDVVRRDVHTLASSAWVVGDEELSRAARVVEQQLEDGEAPAFEALVMALQRWAP